MYSLEIKNFEQNPSVQKQSGDFSETSLSNHLNCKKSELKISKTAHGKPILKSHPQLHFNISHSGKKWAIALSEYSIGVDIQHIKNKDYQKLWCRFFHPQEVHFLNSLDKQEQLNHFFKIWTMKEAYVKCIGTGISHHFKATNIFDLPSNFKLESQLIDNEYYLSVCIDLRPLKTSTTSIHP